MVPKAAAPKVQNRPSEWPAGARSHDTLPFTDPCPLHIPPSHADEPVAVALAEICAVRKAFSAAMHCSTSDVSTY
jgi:hypothetical protein